MGQRIPRGREVQPRAKKYCPVSSPSKRRPSPQEKAVRMNQKIHPKQSPLATPQTPATTQQLDSLNLEAGASDCNSGTVEAGNRSGAPYLETQTTVRCVREWIEESGVLLCYDDAGIYYCLMNLLR